MSEPLQPHRRKARPSLLAALLLLTCAASARPVAAQDYEILGIRYGTIAGFPLRGLLPDAPQGETLDIAMAVWIVRDADRTVLFDTGFFRESWLGRFDVRDYVRPDQAVARAGIDPADVTDIVVSHAHWDHMGGVELFPNATVWIQDAEYTYYTGEAWQPGGRSGGIDRADVAELLNRNTGGKLRLIPGDGVEILPGLTVYTGARHTYASQYLRVAGDPTYVLASDNAYLYVNIHEGRASATFSPDDREANRAAVRRMVELAGDAARVVPGHDAEQFRRFPEIGPGVVRVRAGGAGR